MLWILIIVITVLAGGAAVSIAMKDRKKLPSGGDQKLLPSGSRGDRLVERSVRDLRVDDVLTMDGKDFLCEGVISYDEDGHKWIGGRVVDAGDVKWLVIGIDRASSSTRLMAADTSSPITGYPPEAIVLGEVRYVLDKRGTATCQLFGDVGIGGGKKPDGTVERCRWWLYSAPGDDTLLVEQWGSDYRMLRGKKIVDGTIELIPGS